MDPALRQTILANRHRYLPCPFGYCFEQCDGVYSAQSLVRPDGSRLVHAGFKIIQRGYGESDFCILQLHLGSRCNWNCPYCCARPWMAETDGRDLNAGQWQDVMSFFVQTYTTGHVVLMGGEPTLAEAFPGFLSQVLGAGWSIEALTNFSLPERVYGAVKGLSAEMKARFYIFVSMHPTQKQFDFDRLEADLARLLGEFGVQFGCTLVDTPENRDYEQRGNFIRRLEAIGAMFFCWIPKI